MARNREEPTRDDARAELIESVGAREAERIEEQVEDASKKLRRAHEEIAKVVFGQDDVIDLTLSCILAGGHLLAEGVPGTGKTLLLSNIAQVTGLDWNRIQFTPDLMPTDITGYDLLEEDEAGRKSVRFVEGPLFAQLVLADEVNRTPPKTQAALLEAMQENQVTVQGKPRPLEKPFFVLATQNPIEQEGTYSLPEAQLDRFLMKMKVVYPDEATEKRIMRETTGSSEAKLVEIFNAQDLISMQKLAKQLPISEKFVDTGVKLVRRTRPQEKPANEAEKIVAEYVRFGAGTRAVQAFAKVARARALMRGDLAPNKGDILAVMQPVLEHRMALKDEAAFRGVKFQDVMEKITFDI